MSEDLSSETLYIEKEQSGTTNLYENSMIIFENTDQLRHNEEIILVASDSIDRNEVEEILYQWDMPYLRNKFADSGYDRLSDLQLISELELDQMFPTYREQCYKIRLRNKIVEWRKENGYNVEVTLLSGSTKSVTSSVNSWLQNQHNRNGVITPTERTPTNSKTCTTNEALQIFLNTDKGRKIWNSYISTNPRKLGDIERKILVDGILENHYVSNTSLNYIDFDKISSDIASTFVGEKKEFYYHRIDKKRPTGKLYNKYRNEAPKLNKIGFFGEAKRIKKDSSHSMVSENSSQNYNTNIEYVKGEEFDKDKEWLQCMDVPWSTVEIKFQSTFKGRRQELLNDNLDVQTFYEDWIIYRHPDAFRLIDLEFQMLFPEKEHLIKKKWDTFVHKITPIMKNKIKDKSFLEQLSDISQNEESKFLLIFKGLHYLLKPSARLIRKSDKKIWKISIRDSINAFFLPLSNATILKEEITKKKDICKEYGVNLQPFIVILEHQEKKFTICYDQIFYSFKNILECVSIAFKIHFALNLKYASECYKVWLFLQYYFFDIKTSSDKPDVEVLSLITDLNC